MPVLSSDEIDTIPGYELKKLAKRGILNIVTTAYYPLQTTMSKQDQPEYQRVSYLQGQSISVGEASRRYDVPQPTISRWVSHGYITRLGHGRQRSTLIDEADIAYCAAIYHANPGQGKRLFNRDGTPYTGR